MELVGVRVSPVGQLLLDGADAVVPPDESEGAELICFSCRSRVSFELAFSTNRSSSEAVEELLRISSKNLSDIVFSRGFKMWEGLPREIPIFGES